MRITDDQTVDKYSCVIVKSDDTKLKKLWKLRFASFVLFDDENSQDHRKGGSLRNLKFVYWHFSDTEEVNEQVGGEEGRGDGRNRHRKEEKRLKEEQQDDKKKQ